MVARVGLTARGAIFILIGWVAVLVAFGRTSNEADQRGALQLLAATTYGRVALWLLVFGFAAYTVSRLSEAVFGTSGEHGGEPTARLNSLFRAIAYGALTASAFSVVTGGRQTSQNQSASQQQWTARVMHHGAGRFAVGAVGVVVAVIGIALVVEGVRRTFLKSLRTEQMRESTRIAVENLGVVGTVARGLVFVLTGCLVVDAAVRYQPSQAGGLDSALRTLRDQDGGKALLLAVAAGLIVFGVYGLCEARWSDQ